MTFRVLTAQFMHETNTFARLATDLAAFERLVLARGDDEIMSRLENTNTETAGYMDAARDHGWELVFTVAAMANPLGRVTDDAFEHVVGLITEGLKQSPPVDGIALALHGAMVSDAHEDAEGEVVRRLREITHVPICCTLDLHANVAPEFPERVDILCSYLTYPHIDMRARARRAGGLLHRAMGGDITPRVFFSRRAMLQGALHDPAAAATLVVAGTGARMTLPLGGKTDPSFGGPPLDLSGEVIVTSDGVTVLDGPMFAGMTKSFRPTAVFRTGGIDVLVVSNLMQIIDLQQFLAHGIDPRRKKTVALKSMQHFRAAYEPMAERVIVCDSGALATPDLSRFTYRHVRRPLYPLDP